MKIILEADMPGLGEEGEIVHVASGYARNYLFPKHKALLYNAQNFAVLQGRMKAINRKREERRKQQSNIKELLHDKSFTISMKSSDTGHLYGAVTAQLIAEELEKQNISVSKSHLVLPEEHSIKNIGTYAITAKLYHDVQAQFTVIVTDEHGNSTIKEKEAESVKEENKLEDTSTFNEEENADSNALHEKTTHEEIVTHEAPQQEVSNLNNENISS